MTSGRRGAFTRAEALSAGYTKWEIRVQLEAGNWVVVRTGVYALRDTVEGSRQEADAWHDLEAEALVVVTDDAVMSHGSAVRRHALAHLRGIGAKLRATWPKSTSGSGEAHATEGRTRKEPWVNASLHVGVAELPDQHIVIAGGVRVTSVARTVADIARECSLRDAVVVGDSALAQGKTTRAEIVAVLDTMQRWPGIRQARLVAGLLDARSESPLESLCSLIWFEHGLPRPELQVWVFGAQGFLGVVDGMWIDKFVFYEADGELKYAQQADVLNEKYRQDRMDNAGLTSRRLTWTPVWQSPQTCVDRMEAAFAEAANRPPPRVRLWVGNRDWPGPKAQPGVDYGWADPAALGLRCVYDGLRGNS